MKSAGLQFLLCFMSAVAPAVAIDKAVLPRGLEDDVALWLKDSGVVHGAGNSVSAWADVKGRHRFNRIPPAKSHELLRRMTERFKKNSTVFASVQAALSSDGSPRHNDATPASRGSVSFPCGLTSRDFRIRLGMTIYIVLRPSVFGSGDQASGQRFFGHYPYGQMRFSDGQVAIRSEGGEYILPHQRPKAGAWNIVAYRFGNAPEAALNDTRFSAMRPTRGETPKPVVFSTGSAATLGGTNTDCSFIGDISEVLVFNKVVSDAEASFVAQYLRGRHGLDDNVHAKRIAAVPSRGILRSRSRPEHQGGTHELDSNYRMHSLDKNTVPLRSLTYPRPVVSEPAGSAESLLSQMEVLKAQLDALMTQEAYSSRTFQSNRLQTVGSEKSKRAGNVGAKGQLMCTGDAFRGVSVEGWSPPEHARLEETSRWEDAYRLAFREITHYEKGGKQLREFIHGRVNELKALRHNLFCKYV